MNGQVRGNGSALQLMVVIVAAAATAGCATAESSTPQTRVVDREIPPSPPPHVLGDDRPGPTEREAPSIDPMLVRDAVEAARAETEEGLDASAERAVAWWSLPDMPSYEEILAPVGDPDGSLSMGTTSSGRLLNATKISFEGDGYSVIERHRKRRTAYGTQQLVDVIRHGARVVADEHGGAPLRLGNLSRKGGGDIPWSHSHNSGRDADLAFYCKNRESGKSVPAPDLLHFDDRGVARDNPDLVFDVERNWSLVRALLTHEETTIQWIFVSESLKQMLLAHARDIGDDPDVIEMASEVLHQPTDAPPHADHFHLRIGCPLEDRLVGCVDYGPKWEWADWHRDHLLAQAVELMEVFESEDADRRVEVLEFLDRIKSPYRAEVALVKGVWDPNPEVRRRSLKLARSAWNWSPAALVEAQRLIEDQDASSDQKIAAYSILRRSVDPLSRDFAMGRVEADDVDNWEKVYAARALSHFMDVELVPFIIDQLENQPPRVQAELSQVLHRITNHSQDIDWARAPEGARKKATTWWWNWWEENRGKKREVWVVRGFARHGLRLDRLLTASAVDDIMPLLKTAPEHVVYNVNRALRKITGRWSPLEQLDGRKLYAYWSKWWRKNKWRLVAADGES